jgi:hypothetical protein
MFQLRLLHHDTKIKIKIINVRSLLDYLTENLESLLDGRTPRTSIEIFVDGSADGILSARKVCSNLLGRMEMVEG